MKYKIKEKAKGFQPIEVKITLESMSDLEDLLTRFDVMSVDLNSLSPFKARNSTVNFDLWRELQRIFEERKKNDVC